MSSVGPAPPAQVPCGPPCSAACRACLTASMAASWQRCVLLFAGVQCVCCACLRCASGHRLTCVGMCACTGAPCLPAPGLVAASLPHLHTLLDCLAGRRGQLCEEDPLQLGLPAQAALPGEGLQLRQGEAQGWARDFACFFFMLRSTADTVLLPCCCGMGVWEPCQRKMHSLLHWQGFTAMTRCDGRAAAAVVAAPVFTAGCRTNAAAAAAFAASGVLPASPVESCPLPTAALPAAAHAAAALPSVSPCRRPPCLTRLCLARSRRSWAAASSWWCRVSKWSRVQAAQAEQAEPSRVDSRGGAAADSCLAGHQGWLALPACLPVQRITPLLCLLSTRPLMQAAPRWRVTWRTSSRSPCAAAWCRWVGVGGNPTGQCTRWPAARPAVRQRRQQEEVRVHVCARNAMLLDSSRPPACLCHPTCFLAVPWPCLLPLQPTPHPHTPPTRRATASRRRAPPRSSLCLMCGTRPAPWAPRSLCCPSGWRRCQR